MKRCPNCGKEYDNSKFFCLTCGISLVNASVQSSTPEKSKPATPPPAQPKPTPPPAPAPAQSKPTPPPAPAPAQPKPAPSPAPAPSQPKPTPSPAPAPSQPKPTPSPAPAPAPPVSEPSEQPATAGAVSDTGSHGTAGKTALICGAVVLVLAVIVFAIITLMRSANVLSDLSSKVNDSRAAFDAMSNEIAELPSENEQQAMIPPATQALPVTEPPTEPVTEPPETQQTILKRFVVCPGAYTWTEAEQKCRADGGHLAYITSQEELDKILAAANQTELKFLWVGATTSLYGDDVTVQWTDGSPLDFINDNGLWYPGEPSGRDMTADVHTIEPYVMLWKIKDVWSFNDNSDLCLKEYKSERFGYICEYDEVK